jgi:hypothetical protein
VSVVSTAYEIPPRWTFGARCRTSQRHSGVSDLDSIVPILSFTVLSAFGFLVLTVVAGFARDVRRQIGLHKTPSISG